jgi:mono/diheme cytochrome c family protein
MTAFILAMVAVLATPREGRAVEQAKPAKPTNLAVELGPITGAAGGNRIVSLDGAAGRNVTWRDVQDGQEHHVRGLSLDELVAYVKPPKAADTVIFTYKDGMEIPVRLRDQEEVKSIFLATGHGDDMERQYADTYPLLHGAELPCPKVVYGRRVSTYSIWVYPTALATVRFVTWKAYEAELAQATRRLPDRSGWPLYLQHCQSCHGIGGHGAKRGPDFLSDMDAYRRVPPLAVTAVGQQPSLHEKVKGYTEGMMPVLNHIPDKDIATLWRWLHAIHANATK